MRRSHPLPDQFPREHTRHLAAVFSTSTYGNNRLFPSILIYLGLCEPGFVCLDIYVTLTLYEKLTLMLHLFDIYTYLPKCQMSSGPRGPMFKPKVSKVAAQTVCFQCASTRDCLMISWYANHYTTKDCLMIVSIEHWKNSKETRITSIEALCPVSTEQ